MMLSSSKEDSYLFLLDAQRLYYFRVPLFQFERVSWSSLIEDALFLKICFQFTLTPGMQLLLASHPWWALDTNLCCFSPSKLSKLPFGFSASLSRIDRSPQWEKYLNAILYSLGCLPKILALYWFFYYLLACKWNKTVLSSFSSL